MNKINIIIIIYNPCLFINKYLRIKKNIENLLLKRNIELFIVESCYKDQEFIFTNKNNKNYLQIKMDIPLFHTDNMLNLAINKLLPNDWKTFTYIDADTDFLEDNWESKIVLNQKYDIIQLNGRYDNDSKQIGFVITRKAWDNINYFYDKSIIGMGNIIFMNCLFKNINNFIKNYNCTIDFEKHLLEYQANIHKSNYKYLIISIDYNIKLNTNADNKNISQIIQKYNFNPNIHIIYDQNGYTKPSNNFPRELLNEIIAIELNNNHNDERIHDFNDSKNIIESFYIKQNINDIEYNIEEKLNVIMVLSNPCLYIRRYHLALEFIARMKKNKDINLCIVELCYGNQKFVVTQPNNKNHLQLRTNVPLWHKENMINLGVKHLLPDDWKSFAWIDADIEFLDDDWANKTLKLLTKYDVVQLFSECHLLNYNNNVYSIKKSFLYDYTNNGCKIDFKKPKTDWHPGFGCAITRKTYENINGFFDRTIIGGGDTVILFAIFKITNIYNDTLQHSKYFRESISNYQNNIINNNFNITFLPVIIRHYWHGQLKNRKYVERTQILKNNNFNPETYLTYNADGVIIPTKECSQKLLNDIMTYFIERDEDDYYKERNADKSFDKLLENKIEEKLEERLNVIVVLSNPCLYIRRYHLALEFITKLKQNKNVNLCIVEMCYGNQKFIITERDNKNHLQLQTEIPLWHKENMINLGVKHLLPNDWQSFAWIDADIEFLDDDWANKTLKLLTKYDIVHLFSECLFLDENDNKQFIFNSFGKDFCKKNKYEPSRQYGNNWHPGYGWAMTRNLWNNITYIYDRSIICNGNRLLILSVLSELDGYLISNDAKDQSFSADIINYQNLIQQKINNVINFGYLNCIIKHYYHGQIPNRKYIESYDIMIKHNYNPSLHVEYNKSGILVPTKECPKELLNDIMNCFIKRDEDDYYEF
jgi:hypothetical protein